MDSSSPTPTPAQTIGLYAETARRLAVDRPDDEDRWNAAASLLELAADVYHDLGDAEVIALLDEAAARITIGNAELVDTLTERRDQLRRDLGDVR